MKTKLDFIQKIKLDGDLNAAQAGAFQAHSRLTKSVDDPEDLEDIQICLDRVIEAVNKFRRFVDPN